MKQWVKKMVLGENGANRERYPQEYNNVSFVKMGGSDELAKLIVLLYEDMISGEKK